jgi:hypothetical protein
MLDLITILKKNLSQHFKLSDEILDVFWEFINTNYDHLISYFADKNAHNKPIEECLHFSFGNAEESQIKTIFIFASGMREVDLTGSIEDVKSLENVLEKQCKKFHTYEDEHKKLMNIFNDFRKEMIELLTQNRLDHSSDIPKDHSPFHSPYKITLTIIKRQGTLIVHTNRKDISIPLTKIQFEILTYLAQKSKADENLPYDEQGWLTYGELKNKVESWNDRSDNALPRTQVNFIRKKLKDSGVSEFLIETLESVGYRIGTFPHYITLGKLK